ncbi:MFS transporter [uncultured Ilumatobacter sp.]|jgi:MFS family permease|uniref:MFS transporter n=1 Tax=uncultured Ilumatobacter sp. TaxID=879968 RepID=UPI00374E49BD
MSTNTTLSADFGAPHGVDSARSWVVVASAFLAMFTVFGVAYSFGEFFGPMADEFGTSRSATALFFSITTFAYFAIGIISGRVADRVGPRRVMIFGAVVMVIGLLLTAEVSSIRLGYLTYGLGVGIGVACCYVPMVATVGGWFEQRRTLALGLAVAGIGFGTLVMVPIMERVIEANGWRDAYRVLAAVSGVLLVIAALGAHRSPGSAVAPRPIREIISGRRDFWFLYASSLFLAAALFTPFVFMADYIDTTGTSGSAAVLLGIIGMASIVGRLGLGALAGRISIVGLYRLSCLGLGLSFVIWIVADTNYPLLIAFAVVLGVSYGGIIALSPAVVAQLFGTLGMGGVLGALYTANGLGGLIGPPTIGQIIDSSGHTAAQWTALGSGLLGTALLTRLKPQDG